MAFWWDPRSAVVTRPSESRKTEKLFACCRAKILSGISVTGIIKVCVAVVVVCIVEECLVEAFRTIKGFKLGVDLYNTLLLGLLYSNSEVG